VTCTTELHRLSRLGEWDTMAKLFDDEMLATFAVVARVTRCRAALVQRCADRSTGCCPASRPGMSEAAIAGVLDEVRKTLAESAS
jgi:hypothetical protein